MAIITLTTDFGCSDSYVGEIKGVLLALCPSVRLVDVAHDLQPGDVAAGAWILAQVWRRFPADTVHLAVVDPTVGSRRRALGVCAGDRWFVGPDNGLLTWVARSETVTLALEIEPADSSGTAISDTFHGRDVFAPAAAHLAGGGSPGELGELVGAASLARLPLAEPLRRGDAATGSVVHVDRYGTLVTDIPVAWLPPKPEVQLGGERVTGLSRSFADVEPGALLLLRGSAGTLEVAVRAGSAARALGVATGEPVTVRPAS